MFHPDERLGGRRQIFADVMEYPVAPLFPNATARCRSARRPAWSDGLSTSHRPRTRSNASRSTIWRASFRASTSVAPGSAIARMVRRKGRGRAGRRLRLHRKDRHEDGKANDPCFRRRRRLRASRSLFPARRRARRRRWVIALVYRAAEDRSDFLAFEPPTSRRGPIGMAVCRGEFPSASTAIGGRPDVLRLALFLEPSP